MAIGIVDGLDRTPDHVADQADDHQPEEGSPERLPQHLQQRPFRIGLLPSTDRGKGREEADDQIDEPAGGVAGPGQRGDPRSRRGHGCPDPS